MDLKDKENSYLKLNGTKSIDLWESTSLYVNYVYLSISQEHTYTHTLHGWKMFFPKVRDY